MEDAIYVAAPWSSWVGWRCSSCGLSSNCGRGERGGSPSCRGFTFGTSLAGNVQSDQRKED